MIACKKIMNIVSNENYKHYSNKCNKNCRKKRKILLYFAYSFISNHITIDNYYNLSSLCKTKKH